MIYAANTESRLAITRLSNTIAAQFVWHAGIEPVVQMTLRHRNRVALQSDLLGLAALGIRNLVIVGGYPCSIGSDPEAKDVNDINTTEAIAAINRLITCGQLFNGDRMIYAPDFYLGTVAFPTIEPNELKKSIDIVETKIDRGAKFVQLQASFEIEPMRQWMAEALRRGLHRKAHFLAAIYPFDSCRELELLQQIPGLNVPETLIDYLRNHKNKFAGLNFNIELVRGIRAIEGIRGLHFRSLGYRNNITQIIKSARLRAVAA